MQIEPGKSANRSANCANRQRNSANRCRKGHGDGSHVLLKVELEEETKGPIAGIDAAGLTSSE